MIQNIYAIRDIKVGFSNRFEAANDAVAKRMYNALLADKSNIIAQYPADFELWHVGEFNTEDGKLTSNIYQVTEDGSI